MKKIVLVFMISLCSNVFASDIDIAIEADKAGKYEKAAAFYKKSCENNNSEACSNLGVLYLRGQGVERNSSKAVKFYEKSCDLGDDWGCNNLGVMYANGQGIKQDEAKAKELFNKSCKMHNQKSCEYYEILNEL